MRERLGTMPMQKVTKADIERMVTWMETAGRRRGGKPGTGLGPRSVWLTLGRLTAAFEMATLEGLIPRNVAKLVKPPKYEPEEPDTWSQAEVRKVLRKAGTDRLHAAWRLSLYGLRRGEVLGPRWVEDVKFGSFANQCKQHKERWCVPCYGSGRTYKPATEKLAAGEAYVDSGYVVVDELGEPVLHEGRPTALSLMEKAGVPISIVSKWAGHYDTAFTYSTYAHASDDELETGTDALGKIYKLN